MTDIVERLRSKSPYLHGSSAEITMAEAATEIERLQTGMRAVSKAYRDGADASQMAGIAEQTLRESES
jgi:hypothetical protein